MTHATTVLMAISGLLQQFAIDSGSLVVQGGELSPQQAFTFSKSKLVDAGLSTEGPVVLKLEKAKRSPRMWAAKWGERIELHIDSTDVSLRYLWNHERILQLDKSISFNGGQAITSESQARVRATHLFLKFGAPNGYYIDNIQIVDGNGKRPDSVTAEAHLKYRDRRLLGVYSLLHIDCKDGAIILAQQRWQYSILSLEPSMTVAEAKMKASEYYSQYVSPSDRFTISNSQPEVAYGQRTRGFGVLPDPPDARIVGLRVLYLVKFGEDIVKIDAVNGQCMGYERAMLRPGSIDDTD